MFQAAEANSDFAGSLEWYEALISAHYVNMKLQPAAC